MIFVEYCDILTEPVVSHAAIDGRWVKGFVLMIITCGIYSFRVASHLHKVDDK